MKDSLSELLGICERLSLADLNSLPPTVRERIESLASSPLLWKSLQGPQTAAYLSKADELFYGGAAGGGKTGLLLGAGLTAHSKTLFLRRQATQLVEAVDQLKEYVGDAGQWTGSGYGGRMRLANKCTIELAGCDHEDDKQKWKGRPHDLKAFDELPDFTESQFDFICAWNRTVIPGQRCRVLAAGNPPSTSEGEWVIRRWAPWLDPIRGERAKPEELLWYVRIGGIERRVEDGRPLVWKRETLYPRSRTFIPALLRDNPYLVGTGYARTLDALPEPLRSQLLHGDFTAARVDDPYQVIPTAWVKAAQARWEENSPYRERLSAIGCDVARGGKDKSVFALRRGIWFAPLLRFPASDTPDGKSYAALLFKILTANKSFEEDTRAACNIDVVGVGSSAYDHARELGINVWPINGAAKPYGRDKAGLLQFVNLRAYGFWLLREALDPNKGDGLQLPPDQELLADLTAAHWQPRPGGIIVEPKDDISDRLGRSPDAGDAVILSYINAVAHNEISVVTRQPRPRPYSVVPTKTRSLFGARR
jgi:hypothetical protein